MVKKILAFTISAFLVLALAFLSAGAEKKDNNNIVLIPLDSRPCNTLYVKDFARAMGKELNFPNQGLDNYNQPSDIEALYDYLYQSLAHADTYVIFTNQLINGGLIASRNPKSNLELEQKLKDLRAFLIKAKQKGKKILVLTVLPRVIPSQFTDLWNFKEELVYYSTYEEKPDSLPQETLDRYLSLYEDADYLIKEMIKLTEDDLIDLYLIGQDDSHSESINKRLMETYKEYSNHKVLIQPGADELAKLILARMIREELPVELNLDVLFTDPALQNEVSVFESYSSKERSQQILSLLKLKEDANSDNLLIIHNNAKKSEESLDLILASKDATYLGLADIALVNRGDKNLFTNGDLFRYLNSYSGWNTVGNSLATEYANFILHSFLKENLPQLTREEQEKLLEAYYSVILTHYLDDWFYQAILRDQLNEFLESKYENISFIRNKDLADKKLQELFKKEGWPFNISEDIKKDLPLDYQVKADNPEIKLAWKRTFEAEIKSDISIIFP